MRGTGGTQRGREAQHPQNVVEVAYGRHFGKLKLAIDYIQAGTFHSFPELAKILKVQPDIGRSG